MLHIDLFVSVLSKPVPLIPPPPSAGPSTRAVGSSAPMPAADLISLAEKGKAGGASSSSAVSSSSASSSAASSTSGDEELHQKALRHRDIRAAHGSYRKLIKPTDEEAPPLSPTSGYQDSIPDPEVRIQRKL